MEGDGAALTVASPSVARHRLATADVPPDNLDRAVKSAVKGDEAGFAEVWRALNPRLVRYLHVRAPGLAEDAAAETWLAVVGGLSRFKGDARKFRAWLFTIARSKVVDELRRQNRRPAQLVDDWAGFEIVDPVDVATRALETLATDAAIEMIRTLPPDQAEIVALRILADLDVAAVATIVGKSRGAVRVAQHRALNRLAATLEPQVEAGVTR